MYPRAPDEDGLNDCLPEQLLIQEYEKEHKFDVPSLTTDRGSNIAKGVEEKALFDWHPCICHVLNTAVQHALGEDSSIRQAVEAVKKVSNAIRKAPLAWERFKRVQRKHIWQLKRAAGEPVDSTSSGISSDSEDEVLASEATYGCLWDESDDDAYLSDSDASKQRRVLRMSGYNATRWNSVYFLLKRAIVLESSIREFAKNREYVHLGISESDWVCAKQILEGLHPIKDVSERLEGDSYVTISDMLYFLLKLLYDRLEMTAGEAVDKPHKCAFNRSFKGKLLQVVDDVNIIFTWSNAALLDGRRSHLEWLSRIWSHRADWPNVTGYYRSLASLRNNLESELGEMLHHIVKSGTDLLEESDELSDAVVESPAENWLDVASPPTRQIYRPRGRRAHARSGSDEVDTAVTEWLAMSWNATTQEQKGWTTSDWWRAHEAAHPLIAKLARRRLATQVKGKWR